MDRDVMTGSLQSWFGGLYGWCGTHVVSVAAQWATQAGYGNPIDYIFEAGAQGRHQLDKFLGTLLQHKDARARYLIGRWDFRTKESAIQLQAADYLAYEIYKNIVNREPTFERGILQRAVRESIGGWLESKTG
jgi:hypothetical protein